MSVKGNPIDTIQAVLQIRMMEKLIVTAYTDGLGHWSWNQRMQQTVYLKPIN